MARNKTGDKPNELRASVVNEVAAVGSTGISVNKVAKRAKLSVGTVYRYYKSKEDLLAWVFLQVKQDIHQAMMNAANEHSGAANRIRAMWFALVNYGFESPKDFVLVELMSAAPSVLVKDNPQLVQIETEVHEELHAGIDEKVLRDLPVMTIETVLASPAIILARRAYLNGTRTEMEELMIVFDILWRGIAREKN